MFDPLPFFPVDKITSPPPNPPWLIMFDPFPFLPCKQLTRKLQLNQLIVQMINTHHNLINGQLITVDKTSRPPPGPPPRIMLDPLSINDQN